MPASAVYSVLSDSIQLNRYLFLTIYLIIIYVAFWLNKIGGLAFQKKKINMDTLVSDFFKLFILMGFIFFSMEGHTLFGKPRAYVILPLIPIFAFLHPLFEKLSKEENAYTKYKFGEGTLTQQLIFWGVIFFTLIVINSQLTYERIRYKYAFLILSVIGYLVNGFIQGKTVTYWFPTYIAMLLVNPNHTFVTLLYHALAGGYLVHSLKSTNFEFYL